VRPRPERFTGQHPAQFVGALVCALLHGKGKIGDGLARWNKRVHQDVIQFTVRVRHTPASQRGLGLGQRRLSAAPETITEILNGDSVESIGEVYLAHIKAVADAGKLGWVAPACG